MPLSCTNTDMARPKEPSTAPQAEQSYPLTLGSSLKDNDSCSRFYSLRYEFKPASIDTTRPGSLAKGVDSKVSVEFSNNQPGKPKVAFQGNIEECKDAEAVIFFDGRSFRLERLHRAVKSLRHLRQPGEGASGATTSGAAVAGAAPNGDPKTSPMHLNPTQPAVEKNGAKSALIREHVEDIVIGKPNSPVHKKNGKKNPSEKNSKTSSLKALSPDESKKDPNEIFGHLDGADGGEKQPAKKAKFDSSEKADDVIIDEEVVEEHESDYILEDIDASEEEDGEVNKSGTSRAQVATNAASAKQSSSGSGSSASSSGSGSDGSSSESGGSEDDDDSGSSGADI